MTGMDGISSLHKALGALQVNEASSVGATAQVAGQTGKTSSLAAAAGKGVDSASLSAAGGLAAQATDTSDVRMDKVSALKVAIGNGTYNVPASAVADKMVEGLLK